MAKMSSRARARARTPRKTTTTTRAKTVARASPRTWKEGNWKTTSEREGEAYRVVDASAVREEKKEKVAKETLASVQVDPATPTRVDSGGGKLQQTLLFGAVVGIAVASWRSASKGKHFLGMRYLSTKAEESVTAGTGTVVAPPRRRLDEIEEDIDRLYTGLEKVAMETKRAATLNTQRQLKAGPGPDTTKLEGSMAELKRDQSTSRQLLLKLEQDLDSHVEKTSDGFQDAIQALSIMKDRITDFESKVAQLEEWNGSVAAITERLDAVESERQTYLQAKDDQERHLGQVDRRLDTISGETAALSEDLESLRTESRESSSTLNERLRREIDLLEIDELRASLRSVEGQVAQYHASTGSEAVAQWEGQSQGLSRAGVEETEGTSGALASEVAAIRTDLAGTSDGMERLEREVVELAASMENIQRTNKFSLFLHKFYISLHKYTKEKDATLQDVFSKYDGDCDGALSGKELQRMLADLVPNSSKDDRSSLIFFLDPLGEGRIHYGRVLQNTSNISSKSTGFCSVNFRIQYFTPPNCHIRLCGAHEDLGWWSILDAPVLEERSHGSWETTLVLPGSTMYEYKYVVCEGDRACEWLPGSNLVLELPPGDRGAALNGNGSGNDGGGSLERGNGFHGGKMREVVVEDKWGSHPSDEPLSSTVNTRSNILRMLSAVGSPSQL